jgi:hypothetical protein
MPRKQILTKEVLAAVPGLVASGMNKRDIAALYGCTPQTLQVQCSRNRISLRPTGSKRPLRIDVSAKVVALFNASAEAKGTTSHQIVKRLLEVIVADGLIDAVLDDKPIEQTEAA